MKTPDELSPSLLGHYAGAATRLAAIVVDMALALAVYNLTVAVLAWLVEVFTDEISSPVVDLAPTLRALVALALVQR